MGAEGARDHHRRAAAEVAISRMRAMDTKYIVLGVFALLLLFLLTQRWFWLLGFSIAGLAAGFAMLANIIHFQVYGAVIFFLLMAICWGIVGAIAERPGDASAGH